MWSREGCDAKIRPPPIPKHDASSKVRWCWLLHLELRYSAIFFCSFSYCLTSLGEFVSDDIGIIEKGLHPLQRLSIVTHCFRQFRVLFFFCEKVTLFSELSNDHLRPCGSHYWYCRPSFFQSFTLLSLSPECRYLTRTLRFNIGSQLCCVRLNANRATRRQGNHNRALLLLSFRFKTSLMIQINGEKDIY